MSRNGDEIEVVRQRNGQVRAIELRRVEQHEPRGVPAIDERERFGERRAAVDGHQRDAEVEAREQQREVAGAIAGHRDDQALIVEAGPYERAADGFVLGPEFGGRQGPLLAEADEDGAIGCVARDPREVFYELAGHEGGVVSRAVPSPTRLLSGGAWFR